MRSALSRLCKPSSLPTIAVNAVPIIGILLWRWDAFLLLILYWMETAILGFWCQSAFKIDPVSASNFDPFERRILAVALAPSELVGVAETARARVV